MSNGLGLMIESLVAVLLLVTIGYCVLLNNRLKKLKADEQTLKATISELITATEIAERAIAGLKVTVRECDQGFSERLRSAESMSDELGRKIGEGQSVLRRLAQIASAARSAEPPSRPLTDAQAAAQAAEAFAARARSRIGGLAA